MLLDRQTPKTVTTRHRGKYQFPYLDGYNGPAPSDMATTGARQDASERQDRPSNPTPDHDSASSLASLDDDSSLEAPMKQPDPNLIETDVNRSVPQTTDAPASAVSPKQTTNGTAAASTSPTVTESSLNIADIIFFPEDVARGRENASKLRASFQAEKTSETNALQASLAEERQRVKELEQQLADLRDGYTTRLNADKQEHERAVTALKASLDDTRTNLLTAVATLSTEVKAKEDILEQMQKFARSKDDTSKDQSKRPSPHSTENIQPPQPAATNTHTPQNSHLAAPTEPQPSPKPTAQPQSQTQNLKPLLSSFRDAHIRFAGYVRTTTEAHKVHVSSIEQLDKELEEEEITMRGVRNVVKGLVDGAGKVGGGLEKLGTESDGVLQLMDGVEH